MNPRFAVYNAKGLWTGRIFETRRDAERYVASRAVPSLYSIRNV
jgi:hypothetical protein